MSSLSMHEYLQDLDYTLHTKYLVDQEQLHICEMGSSGKGLSLVLDDCKCPEWCSINNRES